MSHFTKVLITGAAGALGKELRHSALRLGGSVRLTDRIASEDLADHEEDMPVDLADFDGVMHVVEGCDAIVHLGGQSREGTWEAVLDSNIKGTYNIYEAARQHGVERIVYASSVHATGYYERNETIDAKAPQRPDSLYGVSKCFGENLSRYYFDQFGIESVCLRIGSCFPEPVDRRMLITWLSYGDFRQIVELSLSAPRVGHMISFATSDNRERFWNNEAASVLGYRAQDSADDYREKVFAATDQGHPNDPAVRFQGGSFCAVGHFEDE